jgi:hypothetical protein
MEGAADADSLASLSMQLERLRQHIEERFNKLEAQVAALQQLLDEPAGLGAGSGSNGAGSPGAPEARGIRRPGGDVDGESARLRPRIESPTPVLEQPDPLLHKLQQLQQQLMETQPEASTTARGAA